MNGSTGDIGRPVLDVRDYTVRLWARRWLILIITVAFAVAAVAWTLTRTPTYVSTAKVLVMAPDDPNLALAIGASDPVAFINTEAQLVRSEDVARRVADQIRPTIPVTELESKVRVSIVPGSNVLEISYPATTPTRARYVTSYFATAYLDSRAASRAEILQSNGTGAKPASKDVPGEVIQGATLPTSPSSPNLLVNLALGVLVGLVLGVTTALILDARANRVHGRGDLERRMGAPVLAIVPKDRVFRKSGHEIVPTEQGTRTPASEAYATLAANVRYMASQKDIQVFTVTSSLPKEGKTVTCANLAVALAQTGQSVLVVSSDLRAPRVQAVFGLNGGSGLTDLVGGEADLTQAIQRPVGVSVSVLRSGRFSHNPVAVLSKLDTSGLLSELRRRFDVILCDAPPVLPVADAGVLAAFSDGVLFVHNPSRANSRALTESRDRLHVAGGTIVGVVYNNVEREYDSYYGSYGYGSDAQDEADGARR